ncbi:hypothetical protein [Sulfobacillus harzensis]|uniref:ACT domain-containing protein n=1 Tax=Sulfobacillus harzensis TaxID=2729629 RepID=A0A7Y0L0L5_9FIRM|nr:hypothetical protein [Sulfobacillus harzensis]NMP21119.1 hypothetical protein [Sulfobacillus harzensis]
MFVESIAYRNAEVQASVSLSEVLQRLKEYPALMVLDGRDIVGGITRGRLFGLFADYWMNDGSPSKDILPNPVGHYAASVPVMEHGASVEEAIDQLVQGAPLVIVRDRRNEPYGIISWLEVNQYLREITGLNDQDSVRFSLALLDIPGQLARVAEVVGRSGANITALTVSDPKVLNWVHVTLRVDKGHAEIARRALNRAGIDIISESHPASR